MMAGMLNKKENFAVSSLLLTSFIVGTRHCLVLTEVNNSNTPVAINAPATARKLENNFSKVSQNKKPIIPAGILPIIIYIANYPYSLLKSFFSKAAKISLMSLQNTIKTTKIVAISSII